MTQRERLRLDGRVAIVTGAGRGIGRAHALALAERGASVVVNDVGADVYGDGASSAPAHDVVDEIVAAGGKAVVAADSVVSAGGADAIVGTAVSAFGRVDVVVNNAGILDQATFPDVDLAELERQLSVHVAGSFNVTRSAWSHLVRSSSGRVVFTTSPAALYGGPTETTYGAAKAALVGLTRSLASVGEPEGIMVNAVSPGAHSRMTEVGFVSPEFKAFTARHRRPEHIAPLVVLLAHERCPASGEILVAAGGRVARVFVAETPGFTDPQLTAESLLEHWPEVIGETGYTVPDSTFASLAFGLAQLGIGHIEIPPLTAASTA